MLKLPPNPKGIRVLQDWESERLRLLVPNPEKLPPTWKQCITCKGARTFNWYDDNDEIGEYECDCIGQWVLHRYFLYSGIGVNLQRIGWRHCHADPHAASQVQNYLLERNIGWHMEQGTGLYLHGPRGTGKSLMASLFLRRMLAEGYSGYWAAFSDLRSAKTNDWKDSDRSWWVNTNARSSTVLVIDDPGQENKSEKSLDFSRTVLDEIIRYRMSASLPTVITSNQTPENFRKLYGGNVDSLIQERMIPLYVPGTDYRPQVVPDSVQERHLGLTRPIVIV
jgi:hypothetical protein